MKKNILIIMCICSLNADAQVVNQLQIDENSKSGNFKDIITSFYQLTTKDLSGDEKSIGFNSTIYAIKSKADPNLLLDVNYIQEKFARNFQFNFKIDLDKTYKYNGFTGGITYAVINNRDETMANFTGSELDTKYTYLSGAINAQVVIIAGMIHINPAIPDKSKEFQLLQDAVDEILDDKKPVLASSNPYVANILAAINPGIAGNSYTDETGIAITNRDQLMTNINVLVEDYYKELQSKGLLTISTDGSSNETGKFNKASFGLTYLKGNKEAWNEIDIRGKLMYADTLQTGHMPRIALNANAGLNLKFGGNSKNQNTFEIKAAFEFNKIVKNILPDEKEETFFAKTDFRFRITDNLWIPITVKYDIEKSNFLGFLNISYNFGS